MTPGIRLANIGNMPDVQVSPAPIPKSAAKHNKGWLAVVLVLGLGAAGIVVWVNRQSSASAEGAVESTLALETFVVNLTGSGQRAYLRVGITLGLAHPLPRNQPEAVLTALVRDTILSVLATAQPEELLKREGKRQLKEELLKALQERLVSLVDAQQGGQLLARVKALRSSLAVQLGFIVPPIHITDNVRLKPHEYVISLRGVEIARWEMLADQVLAISSEVTPPALAGTPTREPAFGVAALWISPALESQALTSGYAVVDQTSVLSTHLAEVIRQHAYELLTRQESKRLLDRLSESHPKLVEELVPKILSLGEVQKVLQQLLREQVSVRDLSTILETLLDASATSKHPVLLVEAARQALGRALVRPLLSDDGGLRVLTLDHNIEEELSRAFSPQARARNQYRIAALVRPPHSRWLASAGRRSGRADRAHPALLHPRALSSAAIARTLSPQSGRALSLGNSSHGYRAVAGGGAMKGAMKGGRRRRR